MKIWEYKDIQWNKNMKGYNYIRLYKGAEDIWKAWNFERWKYKDMMIHERGNVT